MDDYIPRSITVSELDPGHRFYFFGRICEILLVSKYDEEFHQIWFEELNGTTIKHGTTTLKSSSPFTILLNKE